MCMQVCLCACDTTVSDVNLRYSCDTVRVICECVRCELCELCVKRS